MGLKMWSLVLVFSLVLLTLIGFLAGLLSGLDFALLIAVIMLLFITYFSLTRKDPLTKVPTPLELEKMKRRMKAEESGLYLEPED
ncbi:MAG: hypothetical protein LUQ50_06500 [Methanospirillum sp.]|uniref:hypothetical protein n=1 Tax=Methanospirillum sp. TaxID=45200 RepID=UPI0023691B69|nr:hypothetical protein [Methanospirillum sp.]MDD1728704.1 hypothetical protein [Methanospirillum sp.]